MNDKEIAMMTQFTVAEVLGDGRLFPVVFGVGHEAEHPEECIDGFGPDSTLRPRFYGVHGAGFTALSHEAAEFFAPLLQKQVRALGPVHADRRIAAVPLERAQAARTSTTR
jgi:hypothetical protein